MIKRTIIAVFLSFIVSCGSSSGGPGDTGNGGNGGNDDTIESLLKDVKYFMYRIQGLAEDGAVEALAATHYDLVIIEPTATVQGDEDFDMAGMVQTLHESSAKSFDHKIVVAYIDIGEAESYRSYWGSDWEAPTTDETPCGKPGNPDFIIKADPDGWAENYPVAFWNPEWLEIMKDVFHQVADAGFDGAYLDWIMAYQEECIIAKAEAEGIEDIAQEMVDFISELKTYARTINPEFVMIGQNALELGEDAPSYLEVIDGIGVEDIYFYGEADAEWDDPVNDVGDLEMDPSDTEYFLGIINDVYKTADIPVFATDYAVEDANVDYAYEEAAKNDIVELVTQVSLDGITDTPPPGY